MESAQYTQWETSEEFEMADTKRQWRPWEAGWWAKQLPGGRPALPLYLLFSVTSFLWIALLSMLLAKVMDLSKEVEHLEGIQGNGSMNSGRLEVLQVALSTLDNKHQTLKTKAETMAKELRNLQESQASLSTNLSQELAEAREDRDNIRSEMFRGLEAVRNGNGSSCQPCPSTWRDFQGSCYFFSENKLTWSQARDDCVQKQAHLVIINNQDEQLNFVGNKQKDLGFVFMVAFDESPATYLLSSKCLNNVLLLSILHPHQVSGRNQKGTLNFLTPTDILGYWIGLRKVQEGVHKWIDGTELGYTNWNLGEPNDSQGKENCVMMLHHGKWNDFTCEQSSDNWICEKRQIC